MLGEPPRDPRLPLPAPLAALYAMLSPALDTEFIT